MKKRAYLAAAAICAAGIGIAGVSLTACTKNARQTVSAVQEEAGPTEDGGVSENTVSGKEETENTVSGNRPADGTGSIPEKGDGAAEAPAEDALLPEEDRVKVKGIYVTGAMAGTSGMDDLIALVDRTELNAMVIDVKNDDGRVVYEMDTPLVSEVGSAQRLVSDMPELIRTCREHGIYLIARIVAFKDPFLAENRTDLALHNTDGSLFRDSSGLAWVNPYQEEVWEYLLEIAKEAARIGFDEIQFDYIRFSTDSGMKYVDFGPEAEVKDKETVITEFTEYASERLHELGVPVSADVYGIVIDSELDASLVGQNYYEMSKYLDYISPMVYPSHYGPGNLGLSVPDAQPYETIYRSMSASRRVLAGWTQTEEAEASGSGVSGNEVSQEAGTVSGNGTSQEAGTVSGNGTSQEAGTVSGNGNSQETGTVSGNATPQEAGAEPGEALEVSFPDPKELAPAEEIRAQVRPWLQDFTATWVDGHISYGPEEIRAQIQGVYDAGYEEWILWNAANRYTEGGLLAEEELSAEGGVSAKDGT